MILERNPEYSFYTHLLSTSGRLPIPQSLEGRQRLGTAESQGPAQGAELAELILRLSWVLSWGESSAARTAFSRLPVDSNLVRCPGVLPA